MLKGAQCTLPYPDRFQAASQYVNAQETEGGLSAMRSFSALSRGRMCI